VQLGMSSDRESGFLHEVMSALPPKADMCSAIAYVCFGPEADSCTAANPSLFEDFVGTREQRNGYLYPDRFCGLEIYH
jgi:hypothetical protein